MKSIDAFGQLKIDGGEVIRARLIELTPIQIGAWPESDPDVPILITLDGPYTVKGRNLTAPLVGGGSLEFRRAGCGCSTPLNLRGPRTKFTSSLNEPADA